MNFFCTLTHDVVKVPQGFGSGIVWNRSGHIVTNFHVICDASDLSVELSDGSVYEAQVSGFDRDMDVAVLYMRAPKELRPIHVGVSADLLVGQKVYAIGNPFNLKHTLTTGVIMWEIVCYSDSSLSDSYHNPLRLCFAVPVDPPSGLHRAIHLHPTGRPIQDVIQTDAAINLGNSGGPLLDSSGKLIGVNTSICSPSGVSSGVGFSIPIDTVGGIVNQLIKSDEVTRLGELHL
ncbi:hypothetical protein U9M48_025585 [Paspalum notatum var. saurae]|uniref:Trypsin-like serine protease n=1 Tax=Paspalum notatum var. saurae TaxID=547442 RepID=A0AAQ3TP28_PASNO